MLAWRDTSRSMVVSNRDVQAVPVEDTDHKGLVLNVQRRGLPSATAFSPYEAIPTHWAFGQLCQRAGAPSGYLRTLPAEMAADCINFGLQMRDVDELGVLTRENGSLTAAAVTGPNYGRVWNLDVVKALIGRFGDGLTGDFRVPGEFGKGVEITKKNTTIYASDRDMFVFLADEDHRIEMPNRRFGEPGSFARGFFVWNSEVGAATLGVGTFLFDYVCQNRIIWGAEGYREIKLRHTSGAPHRFVEEVAPALEKYAQSSTEPITAALQAARKERIGEPDKVTEFLAKRFTKSQAVAIQEAHETDEGGPIETVWDAVTGATAYARHIYWTDERVKVEREAGKMLDEAL
jgi:hypothetical protein